MDHHGPVWAEQDARGNTNMTWPQRILILIYMYGVILIICIDRAVVKSVPFVGEDSG